MGFSINLRGQNEPMGAEQAKRAAHWRWIFIDEISMVPANLFAKMEERLRQTKPSADRFKRAVDGRDRPFAGINIVLVGDFKQLPPPQGGYLADIPRHHLLGPNSKAPDVMAENGRLLLWEEIEGVVELTERERCKDAWWNEVTDQLRAGALSEENYRYLHGNPVTDHLKELSHELQDVRLASAWRPMQEVAQRFLAAGIADRSLWSTQPHLHQDPVHHKDQETELLRIHLGPCLL